MSFNVAPGEYPAVYNPVVYKPFRDTGTEITCHLVSAATWEAAADWCGGTATVVDGGQAVILPGDAGTATIGQLIATDGSTYWVIDPEGLATKVWPRDKASAADGDPPAITEWYRITIPGY